MSRAPTLQPYLERLVINVSHDCNLRCSYCYADTGAYGEGRGLLPPGRGPAIVDHFYERFDRIGAIQFFGGEPLLNWRAIDAVCTHVSRFCADQDRTPPAFTVITNGTLLNDEIVALIARHGIIATVSLDGDESLNDAQRVYADGRGSFQRVVGNVRELKRTTGQPFQVEGTFTARHLEQGFRFPAFMDFLAGELDVHFLHMPWVLGGLDRSSYGGTGIRPTPEALDELAEIYCEAISWSLASLRGPDLWETCVVSAVDGVLGPAGPALSGRSHYCPAGSGTLSVGLDGRIYPCFMFTNRAEFVLGRVGDGVEADSDFDQRRNGFTRQLEIDAPPEGGGPKVFSACAGLIHEATGRVDGVPAPEREMQLRISAHLHAEVASLQRDPDAWEWVRTKHMLHRLERAAPLSRVEA